MALHEVDPSESDALAPSRLRLKYLVGCVGIFLVLLALLAVIIGRGEAGPAVAPRLTDSAAQTAAQPDEKLATLTARHGSPDGSMRRVDDFFVRRLTWRKILELQPLEGERPLIPPARFDPMFPAPAPPLDADVFFIFQRGEYVPGPFTYEWRIVLLDDSNNSAAADMGGIGEPPSYVAKVR